MIKFGFFFLNSVVQKRIGETGLVFFVLLWSTLVKR